MTLIRVDKNKCKVDGICAETCPMGLITQDHPKAIPQMINTGAESCVKCGHCVAICTTGALSHDSCLVEECEALPEGWRLEPHTISTYIQGRRSTRQFKQELVPRKTIEELLSLCRYTPTGQNSQSVEWLVVHTPGQVQELARRIVEWMRVVIETQPDMARQLHLPWFVQSWDQGRDRVLRGAPHIVVAHGEKNDSIARLGALLAVGTLDLAAQAYHLGACWAGYLMMLPNVESLLKLPEGHTVFAATMLGIPQYNYRRIPLRRAAKIAWLD
jgi:nitroreductase/NAD-dependent dihydropyrimidine dehydrogenase PreA subunit